MMVLLRCRDFVQRLAAASHDFRNMDQEACAQLLDEARALTLPEPEAHPPSRGQRWFRKHLGLPIQR